MWKSTSGRLLLLLSYRSSENEISFKLFTSVCGTIRERKITRLLSHEKLSEGKLFSTSAPWEKGKLFISAVIGDAWKSKQSQLDVLKWKSRPLLFIFSIKTWEISTSCSEWKLPMSSEKLNKGKKFKKNSWKLESVKCLKWNRREKKSFFRVDFCYQFAFIVITSWRNQLSSVNNKMSIAPRLLQKIEKHLSDVTSVDFFGSSLLVTGSRWDRR